nr:hypothetical protein [Vibrio sp. vnigr-6D03]
MKASPYLLFLCLTIVTYIVSMVSMWKFDTSDLLHRLPHLMLYLFCLGALVANSKTTIQKSLASVLVLGICTPNLISSFGDNMTFLFIAMQITIWLPAIRVPAPLGKLITLVAMSSLFIYLSHFQAKSLLEKVIHNPSPELSVVFALLVGIILSHLWRSRGKALQQFNFARST